MIFKLKTSQETMKIFEDLGAAIHLQPFALCKIAVALSLRCSVPLEKEDFSTNNDGLELNRQTITGEYDDLFKALIISYAGVALSDEQYFPKYLKAHIDRGSRLLQAEYRYSHSNFYQHLLEIDKGV